MPRLHVVPFGPPAHARLRTLVRDAKAADALAPVSVAVPSPYAGLALRRAIARPDGFVNVRFLALARIAELLGAPSLAARRQSPLTRAVRDEALRAVLEGASGPLRAVATHPATVRSLGEAFSELRRHPPDPTAEAALQVSAPVAALHRRFRHLTRGFYDTDDLARAAATTLASKPDDAAALVEVGHVVVHLPRDLSDAEEALVRALAERGRVDVVLGLTGDRRADTAARDLAARLRPFLVRAGIGDLPHMARSTDPAPAVPTGTAIVSAPDPTDEVREAARHLIALAEADTPLHRVAVLARSREPYARLARETLSAAGIAWTAPSVHRLADGLAGRVLLGLLRIADTDFGRDEVAALLASGPLVDPADGRPVPAHRWDALSRQAGVVRGLEQWAERLAALERDLGAELDAARAGAGVSGGRVAASAGDLDEVSRLRAFVERLGAAVSGPPDPSTWRAHVDHASRLLVEYLGGVDRRAGWPDAEVDSARRLDEALEGLLGVAAIRAETSARGFLHALETELDAPAEREGRFGQGVFVGALADAYGADFDTVYVLGMAEGTFPPRARAEPLLRDDPCWVEERRAQERRDYLTALAAAPERVLSYARADPVLQRRRQPARWLLESAATLCGESLGSTELEGRAGPWCRVVSSREWSLTRLEPVISTTEHDVRSLLAWGVDGDLARHPLVAGSPPLARGFACVRDRRSARFTRFDGVTGPTSSRLAPTGGAVSPTALEQWARCPFQYFLARVLRVEEVDRSDDLETIDARERGSLVHAVLEEFVAAHPRTSPGQRWSTVERAELQAVAARHCDLAEARGVTGRPLRWQLERRRLQRLLVAVLDVDEQMRAELGVAPIEAGQELSFGEPGGRDPVAVSLPDGREVRFRGRIDRVDRSPDGRRLVVFDYKTGRDGPDADAGLAAGTRLQLPVYALAAEDVHPAAEVGAYYWYLERPFAKAFVGYEVDIERRRRLEATLAAVVDGIAEGVFPARPGPAGFDPRGGDTWEHCRWCRYDRLCEPRRDATWHRKRSSPVVAGFRALAEPEAVP